VWLPSRHLMGLISPVRTQSLGVKTARAKASPWAHRGPVAGRRAMPNLQVLAFSA
jgi:hypothetical protein